MDQAVLSHAIKSLATASWQAGVLAVIVLGMRWFFGRRLSPAWRCRLWLVVAVRLVLPVLPSSSWSLFGAIPGPGIGQEDVRLPTVRIIVANEAAFAESPVVMTKGESYWNWTAMVIWVWLGGVILLGGQLAIANISFAVRLRRSMSRPAAWIEELSQKCSEEMRLRRTPELLLSDAAAGPALFCAGRARLVLPVDFVNRVGANEARLVLLHEMAHLKRCDPVAAWGWAVLRVAHWFNPLVWIAAGCWRSDAESACDEAVLNTGQTKSDYGMVLLKLGSNAKSMMPRPALEMIGNAGQLKRRVFWIANFRNRAMKWSVIGGVLVGAVAITGLTQPRARGAEGGEAVTEKYDLRGMLPEKMGQQNSATTWALPHEPELPTTKPNRPRTAEEMANLIRASVTPEVWSNGGSIETEGQTLIVTAPQRTQRGVAALLEDLQVQVEVIVRFIERDKAADVLGMTMPEAGRSVLIENDRLKRFSAPAGQHAVFHSPRVRTFNHQSALMEEETLVPYVADLVKNAAATRPYKAKDGNIYEAILKTVRDGIEVQLRSDLGADRQSVDIAINARVMSFYGFRIAELIGEEDLQVQVPVQRVDEIDQTLDIPAGKSAIVACKVEGKDRITGDTQKYEIRDELAGPKFYDGPGFIVIVTPKVFGK